jgi:endonuclease YncB( thermonuclease family)
VIHRLVAVALLVALFSLGCEAARGPDAPTIPPPSPTAGQLRPIGPLEEAVVARVVDGDTIVVRLGAGQERLRYIGIDAPEIGDLLPEPWAVEATEVNHRLVAGQRVFLERDVSNTDRFARLLRYVWLRAETADGGESWTMVNLELVRLGYARAVSYPPDVRHQAELRAAEREARESGAGLWSSEP